MTAATKSKALPRRNPNQQTLIIGIIVVAVIAVIALIALSGQVSNSDIDFSTIPQSRTDDGGFVLGDPNAPVTIIEFADYACPHCQTYKSEIDQFIREYVVPGKAKLEYRIFPTAGGALTSFAGGIAECMDEQQPGAFWKAYERFYQLAQQGRYQDAPRIVSGELGLDYSQLLTCQEDSTRVSTDVALGQSLNVTGTPAIRIRYGDGNPTIINWGGQQYTSGGPSFAVMGAVVDSVQ